MRMTQFSRGAVEHIPCDRMSERRHVYANLVRAPSVNLHFEQCELAKGGIQTAHDTIMGDGLASARQAGGHARAAHPVTADALRNRSPILLEPAVHEGDIGFLDFAASELGSKFAVGVIVLRDHDDAAGLFVEAMDDAGTQVSSHLGERLEMVQQSVDERSAIAVVVGGARSGGYRHSGVSAE